jgi:hypothetical protein
MCREKTFRFSGDACHARCEDGTTTMVKKNYACYSARKKKAINLIYYMLYIVRKIWMSRGSTSAQLQLTINIKPYILGRNCPFLSPNIPEYPPKIPTVRRGTSKPLTYATPSQYAYLSSLSFFSSTLSFSVTNTLFYQSPQINAGVISSWFNLSPQNRTTMESFESTISN